MTKQDAIRLLRTEHIGDSEQMELAKQMGARALELQPIHFVMPVCESCRRVVPGVEIETVYSYFNTVAVKSITPMCCPMCGAYFVQVDIDYIEQTAILKTAEEAKT